MFSMCYIQWCFIDFISIIWEKAANFVVKYWPLLFILHSSTHLFHPSSSLTLFFPFMHPFDVASLSSAISHPPLPSHFLPPRPLLFLHPICRIVQQQQHLRRRPISWEPQHRGGRVVEDETGHHSSLKRTHTHTQITIMAQQIYYTAIQYKAVPPLNIASICLALTLAQAKIRRTSQLRVPELHHNLWSICAVSQLPLSRLPLNVESVL